MDPIISKPIYTLYSYIHDQENFAFLALKV
jgi:hypothetical protein